MLTQDAKKAVKRTAVKILIEALEQKYGSLRKAAEALDTSHVRLANWRDGQQREFLELLEKIRKALKIPRDRFWSMLLGGDK